MRRSIPGRRALRKLGDQRSQLRFGGEVVAVNDRLDKEPALVNSSPYGDGWMIKLRVKDGGEKKALLDAGAYSAHLGQ